MNTITRLVLKWYYKWNRMKERDYKIDDTKIFLPPGHPLDWYQRLHPKYDRFLPLLAASLPSNAVVIDIGANIGDSAIPFLKRSIATICVEPATEFLPYLKKNLERNNLISKATIIEKIVSSKTNGTKLIVKNGTATIQQEGESILSLNSISLNDILSELTHVELIKSDTDGWDHDVLLSGIEQIKLKHPIIFFENTCTPTTKDGYENLYAALEVAGYDHLVVFDNYGNVLEQDGSWDLLRKYNDDILNQKFKNVPYLDILTTTEKHHSFIKKVVAAYAVI